MNKLKNFIKNNEVKIALFFTTLIAIIVYNIISDNNKKYESNKKQNTIKAAKIVNNTLNLIQKIINK